MSQQHKHVLQTAGFYAVFIFYLILLFSVVLFKYNSPLELLGEERDFYQSLNLTPLQTIQHYFDGTFHVSPAVSFYNILGNVLLFIPLGIYLPLVCQNFRFWSTFLLIVCLSFTIELAQYIFQLGATDIDDLLLNSLGGALGMLIFNGLRAHIKDLRKVRKVITISGLIIALPLFVYFICLFNLPWHFFA